MGTRDPAAELAPTGQSTEARHAQVCEAGGLGVGVDTGACESHGNSGCVRNLKRSCIIRLTSFCRPTLHSNVQPLDSSVKLSNAYVTYVSRLAIFKVRCASKSTSGSALPLSVRLRGYLDDRLGTLLRAATEALHRGAQVAVPRQGRRRGSGSGLCGTPMHAACAVQQRVPGPATQAHSGASRLWHVQSAPMGVHASVVTMGVTMGVAYTRCFSCADGNSYADDPTQTPREQVLRLEVPVGSRAV